MTDDSHTLEPGSTFGQYRIVRLLGRGGMGDVYEVLDEFGVHRALKLLNIDAMEVSGALERFEREAEVMFTLDHPGIVKVTASGETDSRYWIIMDLQSGWDLDGNIVMTLGDYVQHHGGKLAQDEVRGIIYRLLDAIDYAHQMGVVHRDLKPANVLLGADALKIADFGLVNAAGAEWVDTQVRSTVINQDDEDTLIDGSGTGSRSRAIMGTYAYMSPEQKKGLAVDCPSDLYSLGLMAFRMLTGRESTGMKRASELGLGLDEGWDLWLIKTLEEEPSERYSTAVEMKEALAFQSTVKQTRTQGVLKPLILITSGALVLVGIIVALVYVLSKPDTPNSPPDNSVITERGTTAADSADSASVKKIQLGLETPNSPPDNSVITERGTTAADLDDSVSVKKIQLRLAAYGPIERLILSDDGAKPQKIYYERGSLKAGWEERFSINGSFRCYASSLENIRYIINDGQEFVPQKSGSGHFVWPLKPLTPPKQVSPVPLNISTSAVEGKLFVIADLSMEMLWVKPGTFEMGSPSSEKDRDDDETPHTVTLTQGFYLGKHEVTQSQWEKVMGSNPSRVKGADRPVESVSWTEVTSFCNKLTALERKAGRLPAGMTYQLPTEAQWEYGCRASTKTAFSFGADLTSDQANISGGSGETTDVGKYPANVWGFHDMHGNVWEWCADWYDDYPIGAARDPVGPASGSDRVRRGGSSGVKAGDARSADRAGNGPAFSRNYLGFRLSLRPAGK